MSSRLSSLVREQAYVGGKWLNAKSGSRFPVFNPANDKTIAQVPDMDQEDVLEAISAAGDSFQKWRDVPAKERGKILRRWFDLIENNSEDLAKLMTAENGKPLAEARGEVAYGAAYIEWFAEEARRIYGEVAPRPSNTREMVFFREPIGVVGLITPWNFPLAMLTRKAAAAIACGCTCVARPAEDTPLTALALAVLAEEAGLPGGVFNVVTSSRKYANEIGKTLCESPDVAGISFTGSTAVGKHLYKQCAGTMKRLALELGGNAPFIVFESADLPKAVEGVMASKFRNTGQTCVATNRILVQESVFDEFIALLSKTVSERLVVGDGFDSEVNQGPLANDNQLLKVEEMVNDAVEHGARVVLGGKRHKLGGRYFEPTIITDVNNEMLCYSEEIFGPVCMCIKFKDEAEALKIANNTRRGLAGYFFSNDYSQIWRVARRLETGMVGVNEGIISAVEAPFGGVKESGIGREGSRHGIEEYTHIKYVAFGGLNN